jgi:uncharacterized membrane protein YhhN
MDHRTAAAMTQGRAIRVSSLSLGLTYLIALPAYPYAASPAIKGLSIVLLAVLPWMLRPVPDRRGAWLLSAAVLASSAGDILLDVDPERLFVPGLCAFLAAHLVYTGLFATNRSCWQRVEKPRRILLVAVPLYVLLISVWLVPDTGPLKIPVTIYIFAITAMTTTALGSRFGWRVAAGAILFMLSDSLLAIGKFNGPFPGRGYLVWATYYAAQYLIVTGALVARTLTPLPPGAAR